MPISRYSGLLLDGRWLFKKTNHEKCDFENIYNHQVISLTYKQVDAVSNGKTTVGNIISRRLKTYDKNIITNGVINEYNRKKKYFAKGGRKNG